MSNLIFFGLLTYHSDEPYWNTTKEVLSLLPVKEKRKYAQVKLFLLSSGSNGDFIA